LGLFAFRGNVVGVVVAHLCDRGKQGAPRWEEVGGKGARGSCDRGASSSLATRSDGLHVSKNRMFCIKIAYLRRLTPDILLGGATFEFLLIRTDDGKPVGIILEPEAVVAHTMLKLGLDDFWHPAEVAGDSRNGDLGKVFTDGLAEKGKLSGARWVSPLHTS
jgi:hypothetical protein